MLLKRLNIRKNFKTSHTFCIILHFSVCMSNLAMLVLYVVQLRIVFNLVKNKLNANNKNKKIFSGLRRRSLGLFKTNCSSALLSKISKECPDAAVVIKR